MTLPKTESMEIALRRRRLRQWIDDHFEGSQVRFLADCAKRGHEMNQGELSGLLSQKSFGEKKARKLEAAAEMPPFFLNTGQRLVSDPGHHIREPDATQAYLWPFKEVTPWDYRNTLTDSDKNAVEAMAVALLKARLEASKQNQPAKNINAAG